MAKILRRSQDRVLLGVCGGVAEWMGWEANSVRLGYAVLTVVSLLLPGIFIYTLLLLFMRPPGYTPSPQSPPHDDEERGR